MPRLPIVIAQQPPAALSLPRPGLSGLGEGFAALSDAGEVLHELADRMKRDQDNSEATRIRVKASEMMTDGLLELDRTADHSNYFNGYSDKEKAVRDYVQASAKERGLSNAASNDLNQDIEVWLSKQRGAALVEQRKRTILHERAVGLDELAGFAKQAARAPDPEERDRLFNMGRDKIQVLTSSGALNEAESRKWRETYEKDVRDQREKYFDGELQDDLGVLLNKGVTEPDNAAEYQWEGERLIDQAAGDWLPEEKVAEAKARYRAALWGGAVGARIEKDPAGTKADLDAGQYNRVLDQEGLIRLRNDAQAEIDRRERQAEAERKAKEKQIGKLVADFTNAKMAGFDWRGPVSEAELGQAVKGTEHEVEYENTVAASAALEKFNQLSPMAQDTVLRQMQKGAKTGFEAKFMGTLERAHGATVQGLKDDALGFAVEQKVIPDPGPLNITDADALKQRSELAARASAHYGVDVSPLTDDEADQIAGFMEQAPADKRVQVMRQMAGGFEDRDLKTVAAQLVKKGDRVVALAMGLSVEAPRVASDVLRGKDILRDNPKILPQGSDMASLREAINDALGTAYVNNPEEHAVVSQAAVDLYAFKSWQARDMSGGYVKDRLQKAINEVTGGLITVSRGFFGGSYQVQPPRRGMTEDDFDQALEAADYSGAKGFTREEILRHGQLESIGDGKYLVRVADGYVQAAPVELTTEGRPIVRDLMYPGSRSSEISATVETDRGWLNIPTIFGGRVVAEAEALRRVKAAGYVDPETGRPLPFFKSQTEAVAAARKRSENLTTVFREGPFILDLNKPAPAGATQPAKSAARARTDREVRRIMNLPMEGAP